jgi:glutathione S-transferase
VPSPIPRASSPRLRSITPSHRFIRLTPSRGSVRSRWRTISTRRLARRCAAIVTPLFRHDPDIALRVLTTGVGGRAYRTLRPLLRIFPSLYRFRHSISDNNLGRDRVIVSAALDRIEHERQNRAYLVGETFTVADLTAAALLGVLLQPHEIQYPLRVELPPYLKDYRATLLRHPAAEMGRRYLPPPSRMLRGNCQAHGCAVAFAFFSDFVF